MKSHNKLKYKKTKRVKKRKNNTKRTKKYGGTRKEPMGIYDSNKNEFESSKLSDELIQYVDKTDWNRNITISSIYTSNNINSEEIYDFSLKGDYSFFKGKLNQKFDNKDFLVLLIKSIDNTYKKVNGILLPMPIPPTIINREPAYSGALFFMIYDITKKPLLVKYKKDTQNIEFIFLEDTKNPILISKENVKYNFLHYINLLHLARFPFFL